MYWLEDPVPEENVAGSAGVAEALKTSVAAGERLVFPEAFSDLMDHRAVDIVVDVKRVGGMTAWVRVAHRAHERGLPIVRHRAPEVGVHVLSAFPSSLVQEWVTWGFDLSSDPPLLDQGSVQLSARPGLGLKLSPELDTREPA